jgi:two-component system chemotaxis response regulator CheB
LPADFRAPVLIVLHVSTDSVLPDILGRVSKLKTSHGRHGQPLERGRIYVAPPDRHMTVRNGAIVLSRGPRENGHRPALDPLFRSVAREFRDRTVAIVLSGQLDDGSAGAMAIKERGGTVIVQDPEEAAFSGMPRHACQCVEVDHVLPAGEIVPALIKLAKGETMPGRKSKPRLSGKNVRPKQRALSASRIAGRSHNSIVVCPECQGPLRREVKGKLTQWICAVGHTFSPESLTEAQTDALERVLWMAVRTLNERAQVQRQATGRSAGALRERLQERAEATAQDVELIRSILDRL